MKGYELKDICEKYLDFDFEFVFVDGYSTFPNVRSFDNIQLNDIGYSDKVVSFEVYK